MPKVGQPFNPKESFFRNVNAEYGRCFAPGEDCGEVPIRAHSVQNANHLSLLARDGHVIQLSRRFDKDGPIIDFVPVGRNQATTFCGLCSKHDTELFRAIELAPIDLTDPNHLFLLAYRSGLRELHAATSAAVMIQSSFRERVDAGVEPLSQPSPLGLYATQRIVVAYQTYLYKTAFDRAFLSEDWGAVEHDVLRFPDVEPSIAASAMFSLDRTPVADDVARVSLNILPVSASETVAVFSYLQHEAGAARAELGRILGATGYHQAYELSRRLLNSAENFVIAPAIYEKWSEEKCQAIRSLFASTLFQDNLEFESEHLCLLSFRA